MTIKSPRITSQDYEHPYRPVLVKAYNRAAQLFFERNLASLTPKKLIQKAIRAERYDDLGSGQINKPLQVLLGAVQKEAQLTPFGLFVTEQRILNLLKNRLRVAKLLKRHPEILEIPISPPIIITGLQRTGTTLLHRLFSLDPSHRALMSYEALNPAPFSNNPVRDQKKRIKVANTAKKALSYLAPDFFAIHPVEPTAPEEDVLLLDYALISTVAESTLRVPSYADWVEQNDNQPAYQYMKQLLQVLSWKHPKRTWILKSPHHLEFLKNVVNVFPGTTVVMTHRDPVDTLPSFCSMMAHGRGIFSDIVNPREIGDHWLHKTARMLNAGHQFRTDNPKTQFIDVHYHDLVKDPVAQIARIFKIAEKPFTDDITSRLHAGLQQNRQHKYGIHKYSMEPFGLTQARIYEAYGQYINQYITGCPVTPRKSHDQ